MLSIFMGVLLLVVVAFVIVVLVAIPAAGVAIRHFITGGMMAEVSQAPAMVIRKLTSGNNYFIIFIVNGEEKELLVPMAVYGELSNGDEGLLTFKGNLFQSFDTSVGS